MDFSLLIRKLGCRFPQQEVFSGDQPVVVNRCGQGRLVAQALKAVKAESQKDNAGCVRFQTW